MQPEFGILVVIEACPSQFGVIDGEPQWLDQMQREPGIGGQTDDVAGVRWNLRLIQDDMQHQVLTLSITRRMNGTVRRRCAAMLATSS